MAWLFKPTLPIKAWNTILVYISTLAYLYIPDNLLVAATVEQLLEKGTRLMVSGQLNDALSVFMQAVDDDPENHLTYFRRGTAYFALGNIRLAYLDFTQSIKLNSGFRPALKQRGNACIKMGKLQEAKSHFGALTHDDPEAASKLTFIDELEIKYSTAENHLANKNYEDAMLLLNSLIDVMNFDPELRKMRSKCHFERGDVQKGIQDLRNAVHMLNDNREGLLELSVTMYEHGMVLQSLEEVVACLKLDQDDKNCMKHYKKVKKLAKAVSKAQEFHEASQYSECIQHALEILKLEPNKPQYQSQAKQYLCHCYAKSNNADGIPYCEAVNEQFPNNPDYQCDLAEAYISGDRFDDAIRICQSILGENRQNQRARDLLKRAQKLLKVSKRRDYYKILGVSRSSSKAEILKAYRKLAAKWHPDKYEGSDKKSAETKFIEIAAAKDVLTDPDMRARYDNGEDPLDPSSQQPSEGPFGPFGGFSFANMHPFEGGHFEFHFG